MDEQREQLVKQVRAMRETAVMVVQRHAAMRAPDVPTETVAAICVALGDISIDEATTVLDRLQRENESQLTCVTCKQPILVTDEWSWLDGRRREPEHDHCFNQRFAKHFPNARRAGAAGQE